MTKTAQIIGSNSPFAAALTSNIEAFHIGLTLQSELTGAHALLDSHAKIISQQTSTIMTLTDTINELKQILKEHILASQKRLTATETLDRRWKQAHQQSNNNHPLQPHHIHRPHPYHDPRS